MGFCLLKNGSNQDNYKIYQYGTNLELVFLADVLTEYNIWEHVASDVGVGQLFLPAQGLETQRNLERISVWTEENLMKLKESKTNDIVFTRSKQNFATRLSVNGKYIEWQKYLNLLGVWLQEDGGWQKQIDETCKKAYRKMSFLTK